MEHDEPHFKKIIPFADDDIVVFDKYIVLSKTPVHNPIYSESSVELYKVNKKDESVALLNLIPLDEVKDRKIYGVETGADVYYFAKYYINAEDKKLDDAVNPSHYRSENGIEVIDIIKEFTKDLNGVVAFDIGNVIKYVCRWKKKGGIDDLKKASWYLTHAIETYEDKES